MKAISDKRHRRIFCLIHAEKLTYQVSDLALRSLSKHSQGKKGMTFFVKCIIYLRPLFYVLTVMNTVLVT